MVVVVVEPLLLCQHLSAKLSSCTPGLARPSVLHLHITSSLTLIWPPGYSNTVTQSYIGQH